MDIEEDLKKIKAMQDAGFARSRVDERDAKIIKLVAEGMSYKEAGEKVDPPVTKQQVYRIIKREMKNYGLS